MLCARFFTVLCLIRESTVIIKIISIAVIQHLRVLCGKIQIDTMEERNDPNKKEDIFSLFKSSMKVK